MERAITLVVAVFLAAAPASAGQMTYSGLLSDASGRPLEGSFLLRFSVLAGPKDSWTESRYVRSQGGRFTALLGGKRPVPAGARVVAEAPAGTGWTVAQAVDAPAQAPVGFVPVPAAPVPAEVDRLERELEAARREREESKRRLEALERAVAQPAPAGSAPAPSIYTVGAGETLRSVAKKTLGDERHWILIYQANSDRIQRAGELTPGQKLLIPAGTR